MVEEETKKIEDLKKELEMIERSDAAAARLEKAQEGMREIFAKMQEIEARRVVGGQSIGGMPEKKEETPREYKERMMRGGL